MGLLCGAAGLRAINSVASVVGLPPVSTDLPVHTDDGSDGPLPDLRALQLGGGKIVAADMMHFLRSSARPGESLSAFCERVAAWVEELDDRDVVLLVSDASSSMFPRETVPSPLKMATRCRRDYERAKQQLGPGATRHAEWEASDPFPGPDASDEVVAAWIDRSFATRRELIIESHFLLLISTFLASLGVAVAMLLDGREGPSVYLRDFSNVYRHIHGREVKGVAAAAEAVSCANGGQPIVVPSLVENTVVFSVPAASSDVQGYGTASEADEEMAAAVIRVGAENPEYRAYTVLVVDKDRDTFITCALPALIFPRVLHVMMYMQRRGEGDRTCFAQEVTSMPRVFDVLSLCQPQVEAHELLSVFSNVALSVICGGCDFDFLPAPVSEQAVVDAVMAVLLGPDPNHVLAVRDALDMRLSGDQSLHEYAPSASQMVLTASGQLAYEKGDHPAAVALSLKGSTKEQLESDLRRYVYSRRAPGSLVSVEATGQNPPRFVVDQLALRTLVGGERLPDAETAATAASAVLEYMLGTNVAGNSYNAQTAYPASKIPKLDVAAETEKLLRIMYDDVGRPRPSPLPPAVERALSRKQ